MTLEVSELVLFKEEEKGFGRLGHIALVQAEHLAFGFSIKIITFLCLRFHPSHSLFLSFSRFPSVVSLEARMAINSRAVQGNLAKLSVDLKQTL